VRLRAAALHGDEGVTDKPDRKADIFADLGSPVSPLRLCLFWYLTFADLGSPQLSYPTSSTCTTSDRPF
jgi:hypothetical protein